MLGHQRQTNEILNLFPFTRVYICNIIELKQTHTDFKFSLPFPVMNSASHEQRETGECHRSQEVKTFFSI